MTGRRGEPQVVVSFKTGESTWARIKARAEREGISSPHLLVRRMVEQKFAQVDDGGTLQGELKT